jgi:hypothetical protein
MVTQSSATPEAVELSIAANRLDNFDREMLSFVIRWSPYGGPPESEVFPEFGISLSCLIERIGQIVDAFDCVCVSVKDRHLLERARRVLATGKTDAPPNTWRGPIRAELRRDSFERLFSS